MVLSAPEPINSLRNTIFLEVILGLRLCNLRTELALTNAEEDGPGSKTTRDLTARNCVEITRWKSLGVTKSTQESLEGAGCRLNFLMRALGFGQYSPFGTNTQQIKILLKNPHFTWWAPNITCFHYLKPIILVPNLGKTGRASI